MPEDNREDFLPTKLDYTFISLISQKTRVIVIGGGRAGFIKARTFAQRGCSVSVVAQSFINEFDELMHINNVTLKFERYCASQIIDKHLVIIAVSDNNLIGEIVRDCEISCKLYLNCSNFKEGIFVTPVQGETDSISFALHTKAGGPKASLFLRGIVEKKLKGYDGLIQYISCLREKVKGMPLKEELMEFVSSEDFKFFYSSGVHKEVLQLFYGGIGIEFEDCNKTK
jgi:precorrin-2 dehydrogenase / sirohydrochlorin ferrochelatase